jgi:hypothetical protein
MNLITPKKAAKFYLLFHKPASSTSIFILSVMNIAILKLNLKENLMHLTLLGFVVSRNWREGKEAG